MRQERQTILALVAMGRLTPREAERLMTGDADEALLRMTICLAAAWLALPQIGAVLTGMMHTLAMVLPAWLQMGGVR
jgi:hypothetical protein